LDISAFECRSITLYSLMGSETYTGYSFCDYILPGGQENGFFFLVFNAAFIE
jgi:hypothetical protein